MHATVAKSFFFLSFKYIHFTVKYLPMYLLELKEQGVSNRNLYEKKNHPLGVKGDFLLQGSDGGGTFRLPFWNLHKIWI